MFLSYNFFYCKITQTSNMIKWVNSCMKCIQISIVNFIIQINYNIIEYFSFIYSFINDNFK